jgi:hypothetical protein
MRKFWIGIVVAAVVAMVGAPPKAQAARLVNGPNFPVGGIGCAMIFGQPAALAEEVFLDNGCVFWPNNEWAIGAGGLIVNSANTEDGSRACLEESSAAAGATVVVNPCARGAGKTSQRWSIKPSPAPNLSQSLIVNLKSKLCLDTKQAGPDLIQLIVNDCSTAIGAGTGNWQVK